MNKLFALVIVSFLLCCKQPTEGINNYSNGLSLSKKNLKVHNNPLDTVIDQIIIKNTIDDSIFLDSAYLIFEVLDSTGFTGNIEAHWMEDKYGDFGWVLNEIEKNKYKLSKNYFSPNETAVPLRFFSKDSCVLLDLQIGQNLVSSRIPNYPKYVKGLFQLHFSNNQVLDIELYSDDLRIK